MINILVITDHCQPSDIFVLLFLTRKSSLQIYSYSFLLLIVSILVRLFLCYVQPQIVNYLSRRQLPFHSVLLARVLPAVETVD